MDSCQICGAGAVKLFSTAFDRVLCNPRKKWEIRQCQNCGFGWTFPPLPHDEIGAQYPSTYLGNTRRTLEEFFCGSLTRSRSWRKETEKVRLVERFVRGGNILDVGCGDGKFLWALQDTKWRRTGVEFAADVVALLHTAFSDIHFVAGDIFSSQLPENSFNAVTFWHVLEHLPEPQKVIARARALLRPGGFLFISLPNLDSYQARLFRRHWYAFDDVPRHLYHYSPRALEVLLREAGLMIRKHLFFSRIVNFHCLKYSLIHWSEERFGHRWAYYALKPLLPVFPFIEQLAGKYGMLTTISQKE